MSIEAILMMLFAMLVLWGGLAVAIVSLSRADRAVLDRATTDRAVSEEPHHRDL